MKHCDKKAVTVNVTNKCNLRCNYCMASSATEQNHAYSIPVEFAKAGIKDAINGNPTGIVAEVLRFFAPGEPTQDMAVVKSCVEYARYLNPNIVVELQTNGLFSTIDDTLWIRDNINIVWFSLDGPSQINDINRPDHLGNGRTKEIERNMLLVQEKAIVGVRATISGDFLDKQYTLVRYYKKLGINYLAFNPIISPVKRNESGCMNINQSSQKKFAIGFIKAFEVAQELNIELTNSMIFNFDEPVDASCRSCLPMPQLNPDGSVSSCDMAMYADTKNELKVFLYGQWDVDSKQILYDIEKIRYLQQHRLCNMPVCKDCVIGEYCAGGCLGRIAYETGNIFSVIPDICSATIYMAQHIPLGEKKLALTHP